MDYDFSYYEGRDLVFPKRPKKPQFPKYNASSEAFRSYADDLEIFEKEKVAHDADLKDYNLQIQNRKIELKNKLMDEYDLSQKQFNILWEKAWEDGHSAGLHEVVRYFDDLVDFIRDYERTNIKGLTRA